MLQVHVCASVLQSTLPTTYKRKKNGHTNISCSLKTEQLWCNKKGSQTRALSASHMFMSHLNPSLGSTNGSHQHLGQECVVPALSWSAHCLPTLLDGILCLQKLAVNIPEHENHSAYFGLPKCGPVRKGTFPFFLLNFLCNLSHYQKKKSPIQVKLWKSGLSGRQKGWDNLVQC